MSCSFVVIISLSHYLAAPPPPCYLDDLKFPRETLLKLYTYLSRRGLKTPRERTLKLTRVSSFQTNALDNYEYRMANRLWVTDTRKIRECMLDYFGDQLEKTDFRTNPESVRERINEWVSNMTKGHIRDLLPGGSITEDTDLVLANAVYFKGLWAHRFEPSNSKRDIFYASGSQNSVVTFMRQKGNFNHGKRSLTSIRPFLIVEVHRTGPNVRSLEAIDSTVMSRDY